MQRSRFSRQALLWLPGLITLIFAAGCAHHTSSTATPNPATPVAVTTPPAAPAQPAAFQPYTLLPAPPPAPPVAAPRHRVLHLTRVHEHTYLEDSDRHLYEAGRDTQGHIYPIYRDPATHVTYPLYYDSSRDNLYRLAKNDNGHFYRNYVGQPTDRFYDSDRDYERVIPSDNDQPIVTDSYNTYNYNTYSNGSDSHRHHDDYGGYLPYNEDPDYGQNHPYYTGYALPPAHHSSHFNYNWLWAIPVIVGAYLLLHPHHSSPPAYSGTPTAIVRRNMNVTNTDIHNTNITNTNIHNTTIINQAVPVGYQPIASRRPVYIYPAGYTPRPQYLPQSPRQLPDVRPHGPLHPIAAAPLAAPAIRAALVRPHPVALVRPHPVALVRPHPVIPVTHLPVSVVHPAVIVRHPAPVEHPRPLRRVFHPRTLPVVVRRPRIRSEVRPAPRPVVHVPEKPRIEPSHTPVIHVPLVSTNQPPRVHPRPEPMHSVVRPHLVERPRILTSPAPAVRPRPSPRLEHTVLPRHIAAPPRPAAVRPHPVRPAPAPPRHDAPKKRPAMQKTEGRPQKEEMPKKEDGREGDHSPR